ncbi:MAG TPA: hypothetical protein VFU78_02200 [Thermomicrobiales bacterium]|jgi:hypothetical protein|nr:hypothetical protein [Thermomicrobiales bacterium]
MIDRTDLDLRLVAHHTNTARVNRRAWQGQGTGATHPIRAALAGTLVGLARRLAPELPSPAPVGQPEHSRPAPV